MSAIRRQGPGYITAAADGFLTTNLYHQRFGRKELLSHADVPTIMVELYGNMCKATDTEDDLPVRAEFDRLRRCCEHADKLYRGFII